jgi:hypothetical protein
MSQVLAMWTPQELLNAEQYNLGGIAPQVGDDASNETSLVSYCFLSSIIPQKCGSGNNATIKINQDGDDAASRPTRQ